MQIAIEVDGPDHDKPKQRQRDRRKTQRLVRLGWTVFRVSEAGCRAAFGRKGRP
jgi:very-short-patch-repair endonuclease